MPTVCYHVHAGLSQSFCTYLSQHWYLLGGLWWDTAFTQKATAAQGAAVVGWLRLDNVTGWLGYIHCWRLALLVVRQRNPEFASAGSPTWLATARKVFDFWYLHARLPTGQVIDHIGSDGAEMG